MLQIFRAGAGRAAARGPAAALVAGALALGMAASPAAAEEFSADQKAAIDAQIRAYILDNPEVIVEAMQVLEERRKRDEAMADSAMISRLEDEIFNDGYSHVAGNPDGDVTVVEFSDYRCGYCKKAHEGVRALVAADDNLRLVTKEFPILGPDSTFASRAAIAAQNQSQDKYWAFNDAMMTWRGDLDEATVMSLAEESGLDAEALRRDMEAPAVAGKIKRNYELARKLKINGTPGFIIGGQIVRGYVDYSALRQLVEEARERG